MNTNPNLNDEDIVDLEEHFVNKRPVPKAKKYRIRIDKEQYVVDVTEMTGRQILEIAGKTPEKFLLRQKLKEGVKPVTPDEIVSFINAGVERFMTIPNEVTEGESFQERRQFSLLPQDVEYLNGINLRWEAISEGNLKTIIIYEWPLPPGYNISLADVHVRISDGYPDTQIDMAYFTPPLNRLDLRVINNLSALQFDGREWQQWSRHRTVASAWRNGIDDLGTHMALVDDWLIAELRK